MKTVVLAVNRVCKCFSGTPVLREVSLQANGGEVVGLVGINGAGKSTLMNIIAGEVRADAGEVCIGGTTVDIDSPKDAERHGIALIHQEPVDFAHLSVAENIFLTDLPRFRIVPLLRRKAMEEQARRQLARLGSSLNPRQRLSSLSMGGRQQVAVARALAQNARIILFDEPTSSLSYREKRHLFELIARLKAQGAAVIYITHFLDEVMQICDRICILRDGQVASTGLISDFTLAGVIRQMIGRELAGPEKRGRQTPGEMLLEVEGISAGRLLADVSFTLRGGEVLGIWGLMGSGRTELVRALLGLDPRRAGAARLRRGSSLRPVSGRELLRYSGYLTETRHDDGLFLPQAVWWNTSVAHLSAFVRRPLGVMNVRQELKAAESIVAKLQVHMPGIGYPVRQLSGGNQQKVVLAKWLLKQPKIFFLDEPTRGVDIGAKAEIQKMIRDLSAQGAGILLVSSEIEEMMSLCDRILVLRAGSIARELTFEEFDKERLMALAIGDTDE